MARLFRRRGQDLEACIHGWLSKCQIPSSWTKIPIQLYTDETDQQRYQETERYPTATQVEASKETCCARRSYHCYQSATRRSRHYYPHSPPRGQNQDACCERAWHCQGWPGDACASATPFTRCCSSTSHGRRG